MLGMTVMNRRCARCSRSSSRLRARGPVSEEPYVAIRRFLETEAFGLVHDRTRVHVGLGCRHSHANADQHRSCGQDNSLHFYPLSSFVTIDARRTLQLRDIPFLASRVT